MVTRRASHRLWFAGIAIALFGCSNDPTGPQPVVPADVSALNYVHNGYVGSELGPIGVKVLDAEGAPLSGVAVSFAVTAGGGAVASPSGTTDSAGVATTSWKLGTVAGIDNNAVTVNVAGYAKASPVLTASALAGHPAAIRVESGDAQNGMVGTTLPGSLVVVVRDSFGNPASGSIVTWWVASGGGWLDGSLTQAGPDGTASVHRTLGAAEGPARVIASISGGLTNSVTFSATATALVSAFDIDTLSETVVTPVVAAALGAAVAQWRGIIVGDLPAESVTLTIGQCFAGSPAFANRVVDDVLILVRVAAIDGPGGQLGSGSPCRTRSTGFTTVVGVVTIDSADVESMMTGGQLDAVVAQQVGRALGFGTSWLLPTPPLLVNAEYPQPYFAGPAALARFTAIGGLGNPEVHAMSGGAWGWIYWGDLMSTDWYSDEAPVISLLTVAALEDMSYSVSYANANDFPYCGGFCY